MNTIWFPDFATSAGPKYQVLTEALRGAVANGQLDVGEKLPPVREVAWQLKITPGTVARAYTKLTDEGVLEAQVGRGTFVAAQKKIPTMVPTDGLSFAPSEEYANFRGVIAANVGQRQIIADILSRLGDTMASDYVSYGTEAEDLHTRLALADWIGPDIAGNFSVDDIALTHGAQHGVITALQSILTGHSPTIITERLAYAGVRHAARLLRANLVGIEMDEYGILPDQLERAFRKHGGQVLVTSAEAHSPTTVQTTLERKKQIVALARKYGITIIDDDTYRMTKAGVPSYRAIAPEISFFVSSLTKTVSGALRTGYIVCPTGMSDTVRRTTQSQFYGMPQSVLDISAELLRSGAAEAIRNEIVAVNEAKILSAVNALGGWAIRWRKDLPFIWLKLPLGWRASSFAVACKNEKINLRPADEFALPDGYSPQAVRLAINPSMPDDQFHGALAAMNRLLANPNNIVGT